MLAAGAVVQSSILPHVAPWGLKVELVLLMVASWSISRGMDEGITWAIAGGILLDLLSALPFGLMATAMTVTAVLVSWLGGSLLRVNVYFPLAMAPVATVVFNVTVMLMLEALGLRVDWSTLVAGVIVPLALLNSIAMVPVYWLIHGISSRVQPEINW